jgi:hypothetical protein
LSHISNLFRCVAEVDITDAYANGEKSAKLGSLTKTVVCPLMLLMLCNQVTNCLAYNLAQGPLSDIAG